MSDGSADSPTVERLDEATVDRIAAGEVITRPARVVGELLDNALDAGADSIRVEVDGDGTERLRVADNGHGMSRRDAERAVERHATSKLRDADELPATTSLGFRGEALPSIAEAGRLELVTSDGSEHGTRLVVDDGEVQVTDAGRARGTTVTVRDLFADRPARRESLGGAGAEFATVSSLVARYALTRPDVSFSLVHDGREVFETPGSGAYADALAAVYDRHVAARSTTFSHETALSAGEFDGATIHVDGVLVYPSTTRSDRSHLRTAINDRPVVDEGIRRATERGYGTLLPDGRHPVAAVSVSLPPESVDANVHPAKAEVALSVRDAVEAAVETGVSDALTTADLRRSGEVAMGLDESLAPKAGDSALAEADVVGQFRETYVLCAEGDELLVIDQHAAHERVNYERLQAAVAGEAIERADLSPPETVSLSPGEAAVVESHADDLAALGFDADPFGGTTVKLSAVPAPMGLPADAGAFRETLATLAGGDDPADARDDALAALACHPSLKAGDALDADDAQALVERLGQCEQPFACPHGRPTVLSVSEETLAAGFER
ncbi:MULTISPECIES: DNA mismatch repair endonuclease MutL [Halolamina]|uniref:DNA mismatch repair protein MutL n=1 Tax=Halolamina pelagica TaxID=699431 RepID=A0A1I5PXH8_9EURY|nr:MULTISPECIES: DNA mismatch repair endonuclease MutL [Halolamina]NHX34998.1 DNA mismatch repair endonuclease MutL [Halolamina sp. R1-12]SFP38735.1 DNA mismatch repair protein MutL [Halolamina pelagica]